MDIYAIIGLIVLLAMIGASAWFIFYAVKRVYLGIRYNSLAWQKDVQEFKTTLLAGVFVVCIVTFGYFVLSIAYNYIELKAFKTTYYVVNSHICMDKSESWGGTVTFSDCTKGLTFVNPSSFKEVSN